MRIAGIILTVLGGLCVLTGLSLGVTLYDLSNPSDLRKFLGGVIRWGLVLAAGIVLIVRGSTPTQPPPDERDEEGWPADPWRGRHG